MWSKHSEKCQKAKVWRHTKSPIGQILTTARFQTVHIDLVGPVPPSHGFRYLLTMVDRFTRWTDVVAIADITTETVNRESMHECISRFCVVCIVILDRGSQFESASGICLIEQFDIQRKCANSYHPPSNGAMGLFHRALKMHK